MSKIQGQPSVQPSIPQPMWEPEGPGHVKQLRRAITAHRDDRPVDTEVAPMLADLLARIDAFVEPPSLPPLAAPRPPDPANPPSATESMQAMGQASSKLRQLVQDSSPQSAAQSGLEPVQHKRLQSMLDALDRHLTMKREVVLRAGSGAR